jgi:hypothetical protein
MKNFLTFRELDLAAMSKAGLSENDIPAEVRQRLVNMKLMELYKLLDGLNDPFYDRTTTLTTDNDIDVDQSESLGGNIVDVSGNPKEITLDSGEFVAGQVIVLTEFTATGGNPDLLQITNGEFLTNLDGWTTVTEGPNAAVTRETDGIIPRQAAAPRSPHVLLFCNDLDDVAEIKQLIPAGTSHLTFRCAANSDWSAAQKLQVWFGSTFITEINTKHGLVDPYDFTDSQGGGSGITHYTRFYSIDLLSHAEDYLRFRITGEAEA